MSDGDESYQQRTPEGHRAASPSPLKPTAMTRDLTADGTKPAVNQANYDYLVEHRVCQRLEFLVRQLMKNRPEDPILALCTYLRESERSQGETPSKRGREVLEHAAAAKEERRQSGQPEPPLERSTTAEPEVKVTAEGQPEPLGTSQVQGQDSTHDIPRTTVDRGALNSATLRSQGGAAQQKVVSPASTGASRHFPAPSEGSRRNSANPREHPSRAGSAAAHSKLERDESARSDVSAFSVASVDMCEFLADFRGAHYAVFGAACPMISLDELAEVVDRVAFPIPDTRMLVDLFHEMQDASERVNFEAFLARMSHRIQGRYHQDVIRGLFYSLAGAALPSYLMLPNGGGVGGSGEDSNEASAHLVAAYAAELNTTNCIQQTERKHPTSAGSQAHHHTNLVTTQSGTTTAVAPSAAEPSTQLSDEVLSASSAIRATSAGKSPNASGLSISRGICLEDGLRKGLGIRVSNRDFDDLLSKIGLPRQDENVRLHLLDFTRLLNAAAPFHSMTGSSAANSTVDPHENKEQLDA